MGYSSKSPWLIHYDGSSCNGCDIEVLDAMTPLYDIERFGIINTGNPKHADIFLVTGSVNAQNKGVVRQIYEQMLEPKVVVACGVCACTGGVFRECYNVLGGVDQVIPVDVYAPGCAVRPETIIDAVLEGVRVLDEKAEALRRGEIGGPVGHVAEAAGSYVILSGVPEGRGVEGSLPGPDTVSDQRRDPSAPPLRGSAQDDIAGKTAGAAAAQDDGIEEKGVA